MSVDKVQGEHEVSATIHVDIFYIDEPEPRKPSVYFERMKRSADAAGAVCAISGQPHPQYHHLFCEYAARDEIDWVLVKGIATGALAHMPVLDLVTDQPIPGQFFPAEASLLFKFCKWLEVCFGTGLGRVRPCGSGCLRRQRPQHAAASRQVPHP